MDLGAVVAPGTSVTRAVAVARAAEAAGFSTVWLPDSPTIGPDPFLVASEVLRSTEQVSVGTMVTNPVTRHWSVLAGSFLTLLQMYGPRVVCGIGRGDSLARVLAGHAPPMAPVEAMEGAIANIRSVARGGVVASEGERYSFGWSGNDNLVVWSLGLAPVAIGVAGAQADGLIYQIGDPLLVRWASRALQRAAVDAGRATSAVRLCLAVPSAVGDDIDDQHGQVEWFVRMVGGHCGDLNGQALSDEEFPSIFRQYLALRSGTASHSVGPGDEQTFMCFLAERCCLLGPVEHHVRRAGELQGVGVDHLALMLVEGREETTIDAYAGPVSAAINRPYSRPAVHTQGLLAGGEG